MDAGTPPPPVPRDAGIDSTPCWFEPLGFWTRCDETWSSGGGEHFPTLRECSERCLAGGCSSIVDYTWIDPTIGCDVYDAGGCTSSTGAGMNEDAGREYRKVCGAQAPDDALAALTDTKGFVVDPASGCHFESIGDRTYCENAVSYVDAVVTGATFDACLQSCQARSDCGAVVDYWSGPTAFECALHLSTCSAPTLTGPTPVALSRYYRKVCGPI